MTTILLTTIQVHLITVHVNTAQLNTVQLYWKFKHGYEAFRLANIRSLLYNTYLNSLKDKNLNKMATSNLYLVLIIILNNLQKKINFEIVFFLPTACTTTFANSLLTSSVLTAAFKSLLFSHSLSNCIQEKQ